MSENLKLKEEDLPDTYIWIGGSRSGKTFLAAALALKHIFMYPGVDILFTAQTYTQIGRTLEKAFLKICKLKKRKPKYKSDERGGGKRYELNGTKIFLASYEGAGVDRILGGEYGLILMDEAFRCTLDKYGVLMTRLSAGGLGAMLMLTNPQSTLHLVHKVLEKMENTRVYRFDTRENLGNLDNPNYLRVLERLPEHLRKRYLEGEAADSIGAVYGMFDPGKNLISEMPSDQSIKFSIGGMDFGDTFAYAHACILSNGQIVIRKSYEEKGSVLRLHALKVKAINQGHPWTQIWSDHAKQERTEFDQYDIFPDPAPKADKLYNISIIQQLLDLGQLVILDDEEGSINALLNYYWDEKVADKPIKKDDHIHDAIMYMIAGAYEARLFGFWVDEEGNMPIVMKGGKIKGIL